jgi:hypothetical protein
VVTWHAHAAYWLLYNIIFFHKSVPEWQAVWAGVRVRICTAVDCCDDQIYMHYFTMTSL